MTKLTERKTPGWSWPLSLEAYDRCPALSPQEQEGLRLAIDLLNHGQSPWRPNTKIRLRRLVPPLQAALTAVAAPESSQRETTNFLLRAMDQRGTSYWAWNRAAWRDVFAMAASRPGRATNGRVELMAVAYLLGGVRCFYDFGRLHHTNLAKRLFGRERVDEALRRIYDELTTWGYRDKSTQQLLDTLTVLQLLCGSPYPEAITRQALEACHQVYLPLPMHRFVVRISKVLTHWHVIEQPLTPHTNDPRPTTVTIAGVHPDWLTWCQRWKATSTITSKSKQGYYYGLLQAGRWLAEHHPQITSPAQWTRELALEYVASVKQRKIGELGTLNSRLGDRLGKPLTPSSQLNHLLALRAFFRDCQEWEWIPVRFDARRYLNLPYTVRAQLAPNPRTIADDFWAKLLWAGLNLELDDLPKRRRFTQFPLELVRAVTMVWLFAGLRSDEIKRLPVGCIRWQADTANPEAVCLLDVPVNKTGPAFTKPVSALVGQAIQAWQQVRPTQPNRLDPKTNEMVCFLFSIRGQRLSGNHINNVIIPMLCRKAGIPLEDARGRITSHRARSTIASQLANARHPMTLLELMQWLGHSSPKATQHYVKISPTRLTQAYTEAGYFDRNLRTIQVLIDQDVVRSGAAGSGETWKYYDLGHGYCSYDFFDQCPHRMACAKCAFYIPKASSHAHVLEAKTNLQRMLQVIPLSEDERAAVEDGLTALSSLQQRLADTPTPAGLTPRQLHDSSSLILPGQIG
jgi:hypothetical protein